MRVTLVIALLVLGASTSTTVYAHGGEGKSQSAGPQADVTAAPAIQTPFQQTAISQQNQPSPATASVCAVPNIGACQMPPSSTPVGAQCYCDTPSGRLSGVTR